MKKILILFISGFIAISGVTAQDFEEVQAAFGQFADDL